MANGAHLHARRPVLASRPVCLLPARTVQLAANHSLVPAAQVVRFDQKPCVHSSPLLSPTDNPRRGRQVRQPAFLGPRLASRPARQPTVVRAEVAAAASLDGAEPKTFMGIESLTWQKILPLGFIFFCILFNYTILRDTKVSGALSQLWEDKT